MRTDRLKKGIFLIAGALLGLWAGNDTALAQYVTSKLAPPPPPPTQTPTQQTGGSTRNPLNTLNVQFNVHPTVPSSYSDVQGSDEYSLDLKSPSNITTVAEYDFETGCYVIHTKLGDNDIVTPFILSADEYNNMYLRQTMQDYYRKKYSETAEEKEKNPFNFLDMQFGLGALAKLFGPGGVQFKTQGSGNVNMVVKSKVVS